MEPPRSLDEAHLRGYELLDCSPQSARPTSCPCCDSAQSTSNDLIVTTEMVLTEMLNGFSDRGPRLRVAASKAVKALRSSPNVNVIPQTSDLFLRAVNRYEERIDKDWSLTDCSSFLVMEAVGIESALTHDQHFAQAGFQVLLR